MAIGDKAAAKGLVVYAGTQARSQGWVNDNQRGDELADEMTARAAADTTEAAARAAADTVIRNDVADLLANKQNRLGFVPVRQQNENNTIGFYWDGVRLVVRVDASDFQIAPQADVSYLAATKRDNGNGDFGNTPIFSAYARNNPVSSGFVAAYLNGDGRLGASASARRFKKEIHAWAPERQAVLAMQLVTFRLKASLYGDANAPVEVGLIAEELDEIGLGWLTFRNEEGELAGVHYERIALALLPMVQDHEARITALEARPE